MVVLKNHGIWRWKKVSKGWGKGEWQLLECGIALINHGASAQQRLFRRLTFISVTCGALVREGDKLFTTWSLDLDMDKLQCEGACVCVRASQSQVLQEMEDEGTICTWGHTSQGWSPVRIEADLFLSVFWCSNRSNDLSFKVCEQVTVEFLPLYDEWLYISARLISCRF